jgi:hypothetical protein
MGAKDEILIVKNINGVDESLTCENVDTYSFNMGSVHLEPSNLFKNKVSQTCNYTNSICFLEITKLKFNLLGFFLL